MSEIKKAMEEAGEIRVAKSNGLFLERMASAGSDRRKPESQETLRQEVWPEYFRTRKVNIDRAALRRHRIFSFFQEEAVADQIKILHTQILNKIKEIDGNSLLVTSPNPGEGKTTTAINLAISISRKVDRTVLLVDGDLRKPDIHRYLSLGECPGLSDYLLGEAEIPDLLVNPGIDKFVILPGGSPLTNSLELLGSPKMEALTREIKDRYRDRIIIFDGPCLLAYADPQVLSEYADGILLVVEEEKTNAGDVEKGLELLTGKQVLGTVLNKTKS